MRERARGKLGVRAGVLLFGGTTPIELAGYLGHRSLARVVDLFPVAPGLLADPVVVAVTVVSLSRGDRSERKTTVAVVRGMVVVAVSAVGLVFLWSYQAYGGADVPLGTIVRVARAIQLFAGLLVLSGALLAIGRDRTTTAPRRVEAT